MDTPNSPKKAAHLLDDLESIRKLLGDEGLQPPLLTEMVDQEDAHIKLLSGNFSYFREICVCPCILDHLGEICIFICNFVLFETSAVTSG